MKVIYRAIDGAEFDNETECRHYETHNLAFYLWDKDGRTSESDDALIVNIWNQNSVNRFKELCAEEGNTTEGIEEPGMYIWDDVHFEYLPLTEELQSALQHYFSDF